jgi:Sulfotransferase family
MSKEEMNGESQAAFAEPLVEIASVEILETKLIDPFLWFSIDQPVSSSRFSGYAFIVSGWVLHPNRVAKSVHAVSQEKTIVGFGQIGLPRPDLGAARPDIPWAAGCGFQFAVGAMGLPSRFDCIIETTLDDGLRVSLARIRGFRPALPVAETPTLQPILASSLGRSGSTLLLRMLAAHPAIVVHREVPYETRISSYWLHVFQVLSRPANHAHAGDRGNFLESPHFVGQNPFDMANTGEPATMRAWYARTQVERLAAFCRASVDSYYRTLARANGQQRPVYFAEKRLTNVLSHPLADIYPAGREIFLVRDFRDVVASIFAFNTQRGYLAFGREHFATDEEYIRRLGIWARQLYEAWRRRAQQSLLVRYEDLITSPRDVLTDILNYLELEPDGEVVETIIGEVQSAPEIPGHKTSKDAAGSIGRWRVDLDERLTNVCDEEFGALLGNLGYLDRDTHRRGR